jgi:hypothetical protein
MLDREGALLSSTDIVSQARRLQKSAIGQPLAR